jgi:hypothetical protein
MLRLGFKSRPVAIAAFTVVVSLFGSAASAHFWMTFALLLPLNAVFVFLIVRVGLLAAVAAFYVSGLFIFFSVTANLRAWYAGAGVTAFLVRAALTLFGVHDSACRTPGPRQGSARMSGASSLSGMLAASQAPRKFPASVVSAVTTSVL